MKNKKLILFLSVVILTFNCLFLFSCEEETKIIRIQNFEVDAQCCEINEYISYTRFGSNKNKQIMLVSTVENVSIQTFFHEQLKNTDEINFVIPSFSLGDTISVTVMKKYYDDGSITYQIYKIENVIVDKLMTKNYNTKAIEIKEQSTSN